MRTDDRGAQSPERARACLVQVRASLRAFLAQRSLPNDLGFSRGHGGERGAVRRRMQALVGPPLPLQTPALGLLLGAASYTPAAEELQNGRILFAPWNHRIILPGDSGTIKVLRPNFPLLTSMDVANLNAESQGHLRLLCSV